MINFLTPKAGEFTLRDFLELRAPELRERVRIIHYEDLPAARRLPSGSYIFAAIDQLTPQGLELVADFREQLMAADSAARYLNHPFESMGRMQLLNALHQAGLNQHAAYPAGGDLSRVRFPAFVREEHGHNGSLSPLVHSMSQLKEAVAVAMAQGHRLRDLLVVEFYETAGPGQYYRKYAAMVVGDHLMPRGIACGPTWMLKAEHTEFTEALIAEELEHMRTFPHESQLRRILEIARVRYGRIDYGMKDGIVETWEINTNPTIGAGRNQNRLRMSPEMRALREPIRLQWTEGLKSSIRAIDHKEIGDPDIAVTPSKAPPPAERMVHRHDSAEHRRATIRKMLRPVQPLVMKAVRWVSPLMLRLLRRSGDPPRN